MDMTPEDIDILARTIYGEARGEYFRCDGGLASLIAVGNVVMNRLKARSWYGRAIREVCEKPWQFSCWNEDDPNRKRLLAQEIPDPVFFLCRQVATGVAVKDWPDLTKGSDHYHALTLPTFPRWTKGRKPQLRLGQHMFYRLTEGD